MTDPRFEAAYPQARKLARAWARRSQLPSSDCNDLIQEAVAAVWNACLDEESPLGWDVQWRAAVRAAILAFLRDRARYHAMELPSGDMSDEAAWRKHCRESGARPTTKAICRSARDARAAERRKDECLGG